MISMGCAREKIGRMTYMTPTTQSDAGSRFVERILTVVESCRQQQRPVFDLLRVALITYRTGQPAPSLLPAH
jgi:transposase